MNHLFDILNSIGLGLIGLGVLVVYRALRSKSNLLSESLAEIRKAYESVMAMMKQRADESDKRFEDEKRFRSLYLSIAEDAESHKTKIKEWKDDELLILQDRIAVLMAKSGRVEKSLEAMMSENNLLKLEITTLRNEYDEMKRRYDNLVAQNQIGKPSIKM